MLQRQVSKCQWRLKTNKTWILTSCLTICLLCNDRMKLIFTATRSDIRLHCSAGSRRKRATDDVVTLDKDLMNEAMKDGLAQLEQVRSSLSSSHHHLIRFYCFILNLNSVI